VDLCLPEEAAARLLNHALDLGLTLIDTARSYGLSEERIGRHLARRRDEFVLSTKVGYGIDGIPDWTYDCVVAGVDAARARLRTDVIDIVHLHSCGPGLLEAGEVARALADCAAAGAACSANTAATPAGSRRRRSATGVGRRLGRVTAPGQASRRCSSPLAISVSISSAPPTSVPLTNTIGKVGQPVHIFSALRRRQSPT